VLLPADAVVWPVAAMRWALGITNPPFSAATAGLLLDGSASL